MGDDKWWENGDQKLINDYFRHVVGRPVRLLDMSDAAFGKCLNHSLGSEPFFARTGPWYIPAFVHKSDETDACFYFDMRKQVANVKGTVVNVCHYHPLGPYWRSNFCDALNMVGVSTPQTAAFCNDS